MKEIINTTSQITDEKPEKAWGLIIIVLGSIALFVIIIVQAYIDHH